MQHDEFILNFSIVSLIYGRSPCFTLYSIYMQQFSTWK